MQCSKGINGRNASRPRRKFVVLMAMAIISAALLGQAAPAPAGPEKNFLRLPEPARPGPARSGALKD